MRRIASELAGGAAGWTPAGGNKNEMGDSPPALSSSMAFFDSLVFGHLPNSIAVHNKHAETLVICTFRTGDHVQLIP